MGNTLSPNRLPVNSIKGKIARAPSKKDGKEAPEDLVGNALAAAHAAAAESVLNNNGPALLGMRRYVPLLTPPEVPTTLTVHVPSCVRLPRHQDAVVYTKVTSRKITRALATMMLT